MRPVSSVCAIAREPGTQARHLSVVQHLHAFTLIRWTIAGPWPKTWSVRCCWAFYVQQPHCGCHTRAAAPAAWWGRGRRMPWLCHTRVRTPALAATACTRWHQLQASLARGLNGERPTAAVPRTARHLHRWSGVHLVGESYCLERSTCQKHASGGWLSAATCLMLQGLHWGKSCCGGGPTGSFSIARTRRSACVQGMVWLNPTN